MAEIVHEMFSEQEITKRIQEMAEEINQAQGERPLRLICILKGSIYFFCTLSQYLTMPVTLDFMAVSSYGNHTDSSGELIMRKDLDHPIEGLDCLLVEDIIDTGNTLSILKPMLQERNPASLRLCTLLDKPDRREAKVDVDYIGFAIPDEFVVGYGLDYAQKYRNLPYIGRLEFT